MARDLVVKILRAPLGHELLLELPISLLTCGCPVVQQAGTGGDVLGKLHPADVAGVWRAERNNGDRTSVAGAWKSTAGPSDRFGELASARRRQQKALRCQGPPQQNERHAYRRRVLIYSARFEVIGCRRGAVAPAWSERRCSYRGSPATKGKGGDSRGASLRGKVGLYVASGWRRAYTYALSVRFDRSKNAKEISVSCQVSRSISYKRGLSRSCFSLC